MAKSKRFVKYAKQSNVDSQSFYIDEDARFRLVDELKNRGSRRILVVCSASIRRLNPFDELIDILNSEGFRTFVYCQPGSILMDRDIEGGLKIYGEYNCDSLIAIGGTSEIDCAKLVAACVTNPVKSLSQFVGIDKISNEIPLLCTILTENCASSSTASAEFFDNTAQKWRTIVSGCLVPHIVIIDTDFSERVALDNAVSSALTSLCVTIEAYTSPVAKEFPEYRASAVIASMILFKNIEKFCNNTTDTFLRKQIAVGGFYAGLATRKTGIGFAHIIMHTILSRYNVVHGTGLTKILLLVLQEQMSDPKTCEGLANLAKAAHFCSMALDNDRAAESLINNLSRLYTKVSGDSNEPLVHAEDIDALVAEVEREAKTYVLTKEIDTKALHRIFEALT